MFIYVLCEVVTVSQLCISFPYVLHGLCEDYLTCDIAFNAVMPLGRASTRGRYSRIEGVTRSEVEGIPNGFLRVSYEDAFFRLGFELFRLKFLDISIASPNF